MKGDEAAFHRELEKWLGQKKSSPLAEDVGRVRAMVRRPTLSVPLDVPEKGPLTPQLKGFEATLDALTSLPPIYARFPDLDDRLNGYLFTLEVGRKIAFDASLMKHYDRGLELQDLALDRLVALLKEHKLSAGEARELVARLQMQVVGTQELTAVLDNEYLLATRELESQGFEPEKLEKEQLGLAAVYLRVRPSFTESNPPAEGFRLPADLPELKNCVWATERPDHLAALGRSRRAATRLSAAELMAALETYKLEKGAYPATLEELIPGYLTRIPPDSLSPSGSFEYSLKGEGYRLVSKPTGPGAQEIVW